MKRKPAGPITFRNEDQYRAAFARRLSNAATPIPSGKRYIRKSKHAGLRIDA